MTQAAMYCVRRGLLGEWWCADASATEEACLASFDLGSVAPVSDPALIRDRLFGAFLCKEDPGRRHVYHALGHYTFINPEMNCPLSEEVRREQWAELIKENGEPGNGPFTSAGPA